ncbi:MAG: hypothetical protein KJO07_17130 [Deltaproteobacteria bacterium]|nr:hypothetical protein [Deltaproteobacteria bacterium]
MLVLVAALGCQGEAKKKKPATGQSGGETAAKAGPALEDGIPSPWPAKPDGRFESKPWLADGLRVAASAAPSPVVAVARVNKITLYDPSGKVVSDFDMAGTPQVLEFLDVDGDGVPELVAGAGLGRETREATTRFVVADGKGWTQIKTIDLGQSERHQVVDVAVDGQGVLWVAHFVSKYIVGISTVDAKAGTAKRIFNRRMVGGIGFAGSGDAERLALARVYGDARGKHGLVEIKIDGGFEALPSLRGARAMASHQGSLVVADGWHREYRAKGRALITRLMPRPKAWERQVLAYVKGPSGYSSLRVGDIDGDGKAEVVATGDGPAVAVPLDATGELPARALSAGSAAHAAVADLDGDGASEVVIVGSEGGIWRSK